ncbi:MAG: membrane protein insertion efficiency factor YidD [Negativicutes bacterium]|nr:membrane protein insertion efficiency factor YidD [Negativicutes bacterium]
MKKICLLLISFYRRFLSPLKGRSTCRFQPTCSQYAYEAISRYGVVKGGLLAGKRILKCGPWHAGGYDPLP